ncbi:MAG TPA: hypothetical protein PLM89_09860, partial [Anaerolineales bacterium]|nr:hypothetical protein [Anaerolineales bacterium]
MTAIEPAITFDFRKTARTNRLKGLWRMLAGYRPAYLGAAVALAISALSKTAAYLLLEYFVDDTLTKQIYIGGSL